MEFVSKVVISHRSKNSAVLSVDCIVYILFGLFSKQCDVTRYRIFYFDCWSVERDIVFYQYERYKKIEVNKNLKLEELTFSLLIGSYRLLQYIMLLKEQT